MSSRGGLRPEDNREQPLLSYSRARAMLKGRDETESVLTVPALLTHRLHYLQCVSVCVCVNERQKERETAFFQLFISLWTPARMRLINRKLSGWVGGG